MEDTTTLYSLTDAKLRLGELIKRVTDGEEIVLTSHGTPAVYLVPVGAYATMRDAWLREVSYQQDNAARLRMEQARERWRSRDSFTPAQ